MADFNKAFDVSSGATGGYFTITEGVEVYRGIDRRFHPAWDGWKIIDALRFAASDEEELQMMLAQNKKLKEKVRTWFKQVYWDRFSGDRIPNQDIAEELFESSIELGVERAVNCLQKSLNLLTAGCAEKVRTIEDGRLGQETLHALEICLKTDGSGYLLNVMRILQALHYISRMKQNPEQDLFAREKLGKLVVTRHKAPSKPAPPKGLRVED